MLRGPADVVRGPVLDRDGGGGQSTGCGRVELFGVVLTNMRSNDPSHTCARLTDLPQRFVDALVPF